MVSGTAKYTLRQLEYFVATAQCGSVTKAAERMHLSQSAMSSALADLERAFGVQLLIRQHARGVKLTEAGRQVLAKGLRLLDDANTLVAEVNCFGSGVSGVMPLGIFAVIAPYTEAQLLDQCARRYPDLQLQVSEERLDELVEGVVSGRLELAVGYDIVDDPRVSTERLVEVPPYVLVRSEDSQGRREVELRSLADRPFILLDLPHSSSYFERLFRDAGLEPNIRYRTKSVETARALVGLGLGYTILNLRPRHTSTVYGQQVTPISLQTTTRSPAVTLMTPAGVRPSERVTAVSQLFESLVPATIASDRPN